VAIFAISPAASVLAEPLGMVHYFATPILQLRRLAESDET
jgi:hypothetical protein